jgi:hypothetical protein
VIEAEVWWLWPQCIAAGKLNLLVGDPDIGKSLSSCGSTLIELDLYARRSGKRLSSRVSSAA